MKIIVTGGAGFIGSALIRHIIAKTEHTVLNIDKLTYAGNLHSLDLVAKSPQYHFAQTDICDGKALSKAFEDFQPDLIIHLAAESHVDRSIDGPSIFVETNILGTYQLLEASRGYWSQLPHDQKKAFRFHHVSTDEVFGDLQGHNDLFTELTPYAPSSPYSASKAGSDHLVRAWYRTYGLPIVLTNCSNNYGPFQFPEKLIPHMILNALQGKKLPVYGNGKQVRDWLYVDDHASALLLVALRGAVGETYNIGGCCEMKNIDVVEAVCDLLEDYDKSRQVVSGKYKNLIEFVEDRPGHDVRYAIDVSKIKGSLGWEPQETFSSGLKKTVDWYLNNPIWWQSVINGDYRLQRVGNLLEV